MQRLAIFLLRSVDESSVLLWSTKVKLQANLAWDYQKGENGMESMNEEKELLEHVMKLMAEHFREKLRDRAS